MRESEESPDDLHDDLQDVSQSKSSDETLGYFLDTAFVNSHGELQREIPEDPYKECNQPQERKSSRDFWFDRRSFRDTQGGGSSASCVDPKRGVCENKLSVGVS